MSQGWISLHRQIQDNFLWQDKPFAMGQAWVDLLLLAYREDTKRVWRGELVEYKRGTVNVSMTFLAERWGWSWRKVKRFLNLLEKEGMIEQNVTTRNTAILLKNYDVFQGERRTNVRTDVTTDVRTDVIQSINNNKINNDNNSAPRHASRRESYSERLKREDEIIEEAIRAAREEDERHGE